MRDSGHLITFEGTEGAGKSTLIREVAARLESLGHEVVMTREPGGTPLAEKVRAVILGQTMDPWAELLLYEAARAEHLAKLIRPALQAGKIVLCDRFTDSTLAYQAHARGLPWKEVKALNRVATQGREPDLTVLLDIDPALGLSRARELTRFEAEGVEFQKKVRQGFLKSRKEKPARWLTLRVEGASPAELAEGVIQHLQKKFFKKRTRRG